MARVYSIASNNAERRKKLQRRSGVGDSVGGGHDHDYSPGLVENHPPPPPALLPKDEALDITTSASATATTATSSSTSASSSSSTSKVLSASLPALTAALLRSNTHDLNKADMDMLTAVTAAAALTKQNKGVSSATGGDDSGETPDKESESNELMEPALQLLGLAQSTPTPANVSSNANTTANSEQSVETVGPDQVKRGAWTEEEDELLVMGIKRFGYGRWKEIASLIPGRKGKQLKQRWDNNLTSKYVDTALLQAKLQAAADDDTQKQQQHHQQQQQQHPNHHHHHHHQTTMPSYQPSSSSDTTAHSTTTTPTPSLAPRTADLADFAQKLAEKARESNNTQLIEALLSQALLQQSSSASDASAHLLDVLSLYSNHHTLQAAHGEGTSSNGDAFHNDTHEDAQQHHQQQQHHALLLAAAAVASMTSAQQQHQQQHQQQQQQQQQQHQQSASPHRQERKASAPRKRRRSDPALAETQSAAMSIYASANPITTVVNDETQMVYPCLFPGCGKTFARLYNLKSHSRTHTDDRPFTCKFCEAAFSRNHDLKRHSKIHEGNKPHKCNGCNKVFSRLDALKRHKSNQKTPNACTEPV